MGFLESNSNLDLNFIPGGQFYVMSVSCNDLAPNWLPVIYWTQFTDACMRHQVSAS